MQVVCAKDLQELKWLVLYFHQQRLELIEIVIFVPTGLEMMMLLLILKHYAVPEKHHFLHPNTLWSPEKAPLSEASFMPISRIACRCMQGDIPDMNFPDRPHNNRKAVIINPISCANLLF